MTGFANIVRWQSHLNVLGLDIDYFSNELSGRLANRVIETGQAVRGVAMKFLEAILYITLYFGGTIFVLGYSSLLMMLPSLLWLLIFLCILLILMPKVRLLSHKHSLLRSKMTGRIVDTYANINLVKLFARKNYEQLGAADAIDDFNYGWAKVMRISFVMDVLMSVANAILIIGTVGFGLYLLSISSVSAGIVAASLPLTLRISEMSWWIMWEVSYLFENIGTIDEGRLTISKKPTILDVPKAKDLQISGGEINFKKVKFNYGKPGGLFEELSMNISPGEKVGLVGRSGAGKSSILNLLLRFYDVDSGQILIDEQDISKIKQESLRSQIGVVTQETALLNRSIFENISYGFPAADKKSVYEAAKKAEAYDFISDLEDKDGRKGFQAYVGERGVRLSGGQRQRIAIARVLLKDAPILILDEATSALDSEVEAAIQNQLNNILQNRTALVIAHRLSTINKLDRLIVMDGGKVVEMGTHDNLLRKSGHYSKLWSLQSGGFLPTL
jgi:ATP-binding cassette subfamily B multidrug efflux pump